MAFVGFQAEYTLGRRLVDGEKSVRIFGDWFEPKAEIVTLNAFSAHADRKELVHYVMKVAPKKVFLVHGEPDQRAALAKHLKKRKQFEVYTPAKGQVVEI